jgi:transposase InsO family protein
VSDAQLALAVSDPTFAGSSPWVVDSGASVNVTPHASDITRWISHEVTYLGGIGGSTQCVGSGDVQVKLLDSQGRVRTRIIHDVRVCPQSPARLLASIPDGKKGYSHNIGGGRIEHSDFHIPIDISGRLPVLMTLICDQHGCVDASAGVGVLQHAFLAQAGELAKVAEDFVTLPDTFTYVLWNGGLGLVASAWNAHGHVCKGYFSNDQVASASFRRSYPNVPVWKSINDLCRTATVASKQFVSAASSADVGYSGVSNQLPSDVCLCTVAQVELLKLVRHKVMIFEFDRKFTDWANAGGTSEYESFIQKFKGCGYEVTQQVVDGRQFGSSLCQPRLLVMGVAHGVGHTVGLGFRGVVAELADSPYFGFDAASTAPPLSKQMSSKIDVERYLLKFPIPPGTFAERAGVTPGASSRAPVVAGAYAAQGGATRSVYEFSGPAVSDEVASDGTVSEALYVDRRFEPAVVRGLLPAERMRSLGCVLPTHSAFPGLTPGELRERAGRATDVSLALSVAHVIARTLVSIGAADAESLLAHVQTVDRGFVCTSVSWDSGGTTPCFALTRSQSSLEVNVEPGGNQHPAEGKKPTGLPAGETKHPVVSAADHLARAQAKVAAVQLRKAGRVTGTDAKAQKEEEVASEKSSIPSSWSALTAHCRLGHPGDKVMHSLGYPAWKNEFCSVCAAVKARRVKKSVVPRMPATKCGQRVHVDFAGPFEKDAMHGHVFLIGFIDAYSNRVHIFGISYKDEATAKLKIVLAHYEAAGYPIQQLCADSDAVFTDGSFADVCVERFVEQEYSSPYDQYQNGPIESLWSRLKLKVATNLAQCGMDGSWWLAAALHANETLNRLPSESNVGGVSPNELWFGRVPARKHMRAFGAVAYVWDPGFQATGERSQRGIFLYYGQGYGDGALTVYMPRTKRLRVSRHVVLDESEIFASPHDKVSETVDNLINQWEEEWKSLADSASPILHEEEIVGSESFERSAVAKLDVKGNTHVGGGIVPRSDPLQHAAKVGKAALHAAMAEALNSAAQDPGYAGVILPAKTLKGAPYIQQRIKLVAGKTPREALQVSVPFNASGKKRLYKMADMKYDYKLGRFALDGVDVNYADVVPDLFSKEEVDDIAEIYGAVGGQGAVAQVLLVDEGGIEHAFNLVPQSGVACHAYATDADNPTFRAAQRAADWPKWKEAIDKEYKGIADNQTWKLVPDFAGSKPLGSKLVLKIKRLADGSVDKYKARLCILGNHQTPDQYGDIFAPVAQLKTFRLLCAIAAKYDLVLLSTDAQQAFLQADMDVELYLKQPPGYEVQLDSSGRPKILRLLKSLYGARQSPSLWHKKLDQWLVGRGPEALSAHVDVDRAGGCPETGEAPQAASARACPVGSFERAPGDSCLYRLRRGKEQLLFMLYVDDSVITYDKKVSQGLYDDFVAALHEDFKFDPVVPLEWFLKFEVKQDLREGTVHLSQMPFVRDFDEECGFTECRSAFTPSSPGLAPGTKWCPEAGSEEQREQVKRPYRSRIGSMLWVSRGTRPQLSYITGVLSTVLENPGAVHWKQVDHAVRYLCTTMNTGITYRRDAPTGKLYGAVDADFLPNYGVEFENFKSTTGWVFFYAGAAVSWKSKRQDVIATSSCHSETIAAFDAAKEAVHLRGLLEFCGYPCEGPTVLEEDNRGAIDLSKYPCHSERTKHWGMYAIWLREAYERRDIVLEYVATNEQMADGFTKALPGPALAVADLRLTGQSKEKAFHEIRRNRAGGAEANVVVEDGLCDEHLLELSNLCIPL